MTYPRRWFGPLSLEVPPGLFEDETAPEGYAAALTALAPATLRIRPLDLAGERCLSDVMARLCGGTPREVEAAGLDYLWPGLAVDVEGEPRQTHYLFETGGQVWHGIVEAGQDLWADYAPFLEGAMLSIDVGEMPAPALGLLASSPLPVGVRRPELSDPVAEVRRRLAEASEAATELIVALRFVEAEAMLRDIDRDIMGANAIAGAYEAALFRSPSRADILERAINWAGRAFPEPHTAMEAEDYRSAAAQREARLRGIYRSE